MPRFDFRIFLLPVAALSLLSPAGPVPHAHAFSFATSYPVTVTDNAGHAHLRDPKTGITVALSNSNTNVSFGIISSRLETPGSAVDAAPLSGPEYFGLALLGISSGNARICVPSDHQSPRTEMLYWDSPAWSWLSAVTKTDGKICGSVPVGAFVGSNFVSSYTDIAVGQMPGMP
ncbi:MAG: hypothetical protein KGI33_05380 [Thaumarchaeota archaeon]|nr:hypothetical protein [Nitrososphaerota archaeon]